MSDDEDNTVVLFTGYNTRLTQFAAPRHGDHDSPPPPQARIKESLVASGTLVIYKMLGREKAAFIKCGSFVHPILPKSRMWRTSSDEFVLPQPIPGKYYRVQLVAPQDETRPDAPDAKKSTQNSAAAELERVFKDSCRYRNAIASRKRHTFAVRSSSPDTFTIPQLRHVSDSRLHKPVSTPLLRVESDSEESQSDSCHSLDRLQEQDSEDNYEELKEQDSEDNYEQLQQDSEDNESEQPKNEHNIPVPEQDNVQLHNEHKDEHEQHEQPVQVQLPPQQEQQQEHPPGASGIESPSTDYSSSASTLDRILESFPQSFPYLQPTGPSSVGEQPIAEVDPSVKSSSTSAMSLSSSASSGATSNTSVLEERPPPFVGPLAPTTSYLSHPLVPLATRNNILSSTFPLRFNPMDDDWLESPQASPSTPRTSTIRPSSNQNQSNQNQSPRTPVQGSFPSYTVSSSSSLSPPPRTPSPFSGSPRPTSQRSRRRSNRSQRSDRSVQIADSPRKYKGLMNSPGSTSPPTIGTSASEAIAYVSRPRQEHDQQQLPQQPDFYHQAVTVTGYVGRKLWNRLSWAPRDDS